MAMVTTTRLQRRIILLILLSFSFIGLISHHQQNNSPIENQLWSSDSSFFRCHCGINSAEIIDKDEINFNDTTCSLKSYLRGKGQKVIGFSYYGDSRSKHHQEKKYFEGLKSNLALLPQYYPDWIIRLYYDPASSEDPVLPKLCHLSCSSGHLDLCDIQRLPGTPKRNATFVFPMNWRFFPTIDPQVDIYLSRDLDSQFNDREMAAVNEWLDSTEAFHMMRDHPLHNTELLGSAWGVKLSQAIIRQKWRRAWANGFRNEIMWKARNLTGPDQGFLTKFVWPWAKKDAMQHDSYLCRRYSGTRPFPVRRKNETNNFVAAVVAQKQYIWKTCPEKCRPAEHKDWEQC